MFDVSLQLLCTSKSGTLSRVIREINLLGLQYKNHQIEFVGEHTCITVNAMGVELYARVPRGLNSIQTGWINSLY